MPRKSAKWEQANSSDGTSKAAVDASTLQAFRDIVKEVIQEENDSLQADIKRAISPIKIALDECADKLCNHEEGLDNLDIRLEAVETCYVALSNQYKNYS